MDLLNQLGGLNPIVLSQQTNSLIAAGTAAQLDFLARQQAQNSFNVKDVVADLVNNNGNGIQKNVKDLLLKMEAKYNATSSPTEKQAIAAHIAKLAGLNNSGVMVDAAKKTLLTPFTDASGKLINDPRTGKPFTAASIADTINALAAEKVSDGPIHASTRGDVE